MPTASSFDKIVTTKGVPSKQRDGFLYRLAAERITGRIEERYASQAMLDGIEREREAIMVYAMNQEVEVLTVGFCLSDDERYGCSPDGLVGEDGLVEVKCPIGKTAVEYLCSGNLPTAYYQQVQGQLLVTGRYWCDFVSYYRGLPMFIIRVMPSDAFINPLRQELKAFCADLDAICEHIGKEGE